jgi:predicted DNA-binding protein (UPF0251 family)
MAQEQFTISEAAKQIGISRPTLYRYLSKPEYKPKTVAGFPVLSATQINGIRAERRAAKKKGR